MSGNRIKTLTFGNILGDVIDAFKNADPHEVSVLYALTCPDKRPIVPGDEEGTWYPIVSEYDGDLGTNS